MESKYHGNGPNKTKIGTQYARYNKKKSRVIKLETFYTSVYM